MAGPLTDKLLGELDAAVRLLTDAGESHWAAWLTESIRRIRRGDRTGLEHLLRAFGGMGSINDLSLCAANGHTVPAVEAQAVNARLREHLAKAQMFAEEILRSLDT